jgi:hypothetical protein
MTSGVFYMLELGVFFAMTRPMLCTHEVVSFRKVDVWSEGASDAGPHSGIRLNYAHIHDWLQFDWSHTISLNVGNAYETPFFPTSFSAFFLGQDFSLRGRTLGPS